MTATQQTFIVLFGSLILATSLLCAGSIKLTREFNEADLLDSCETMGIYYGSDFVIECEVIKYKRLGE